MVGQSSNAGGGQPDEWAPLMSLRARLCAMQPTDVGLDAAPGAVWGALVDMSSAAGVATLVGLADGTTSLYTSSGGGVLGAGEHEHVRAVTASFLAAVAAAVGHLAAVDVTALPRPGFVQVVALRASQPPVGRLVPERELVAMTHALSPAFVAAHNVITELRLLEQSRPQ
jgi:hypothetical protein